MKMTRYRRRIIYKSDTKQGQRDIKLDRILQKPVIEKIKSQWKNLIQKISTLL